MNRPGDAVAWLESPECDRWRRVNLWPRLTEFACIMPEGAFSTHTRRDSEGPVRPEHDPCGRPPMPP